ncbi:MAG: AraC family transcriptional regulator [Kiritimatiellales bacterium]|jgi:AraC-like DNA-binding protein/quercetin dioxygenase-like cupin family protein
MSNMDHPKRAAGFARQVFHLIPRGALRLLEPHRLMKALRVTDIGWYPSARNHFRERPQGAEQHILILCVDGSGWVKSGPRRETVSAGQAVLIPAGVPHAYGASPRTPWSIHWVHFDGADTSFYLQMAPAAGFCVPVDSRCADAMVPVFQRCYETLAGGYADRNLIYLSHALRDLLGLLYYNNPAYSPDERAGAGRDLGNIMTFMAERIGQPLRVSEMARHVGMSAAHFASSFRRQTGMAPGEYFIHLRLRQACWLLDTTSLSIREVGFKVGYDDPYYFSRAFSNLMGLSPRRYRNLRKG